MLREMLLASTQRRKYMASLSGQHFALVGPLERLGHGSLVIVDKSENFGLHVLNQGK